jgi:hypothetical protein
MNEVVADGDGWRGEGVSSEGEPERMSGRADSIGRTYQDDSERSFRRKANEAETGWSQPAHNCRRDPRQRSSLREFLCRIWYLCWNLTITSLLNFSIRSISGIVSALAGRPPRTWARLPRWHSDAPEFDSGAFGDFARRKAKNSGTQNAFLHTL